MLKAYRRHVKPCPHRTSFYLKCRCPLWVMGTLAGKFVRRSLDTRNLERAGFLLREIEDGARSLDVVTVEKACGRFLSDCEARGIGPAQTGKYKLLVAELKAEFGPQNIRNISVNDLRKFREKWKLAPITASKKLERMRTFFSFCVSSGWLGENPAKVLKAPSQKPQPTLPFSGDEWKKILWGLDTYCEVHPKVPAPIQAQLKGLVLLMRYSGLRISDAVSLKKDRISASKLFLYQAKTGHPVAVPLPSAVLRALEACDEGNPHYFWSGVGKLKTAITMWQERLKRLFELAGVPDGHSHRLRDTFSVDLLSRGVPLQTVSILLGHQSVKTTEKHYSPFVKSSQDALEAAVMRTWA